MFDYETMKQPEKYNNNVSKYNLVETKGTDVIDIPNRKQVKMKEMIENRVLEVLNNRPTQPSDDNTQSKINAVRNDESTTNFPQPIKIAEEKKALVKRKKDLCSWGEWGAYEACTEISVGVCESVRVRIQMIVVVIILRWLSVTARILRD